METFILTYKSTFRINDHEMLTEDHTETYRTYEEAEDAAWNNYYFDGPCTLWNIRINGEDYLYKEA